MSPFGCCHPQSRHNSSTATAAIGPHAIRPVDPQCPAFADTNQTRYICIKEPCYRPSSHRPPSFSRISSSKIMKFNLSLAALLGALSAVAASPTRSDLLDGLLGFVAHNVSEVDSRPDAQHPFIYPGLTDQRGPCPGQLLAYFLRRCTLNSR